MSDIFISFASPLLREGDKGGLQGVLGDGL
jgi:hypothetical protein